MKALLLCQVLVLIVAMALSARAIRLKDMANIRGVRSNQLIGYGLVVGLSGTGDSKLEFTNKSVKRMLDKLGIKVNGEDVASKNVAAVLVTATLPAFARAGNTIDLLVNSIGDASSLRGGTLIQTPLRAADQQIYVVAQGPVTVGKAGQSHSTVGYVSNGGIIERDFTENFTNRKMYRITLQNPDFTTAARVSKTLNKDLGGKYATAKDAATIDIVTPVSFEGRGVELLATIESVEITPDARARVIVNEKTGTVIIGEKVKVSKVAISHGDLTLRVGKDGEEKKGKKNQDRVALLSESVSVGDLVKSLNMLGVTPQDLIVILQNIKAAGAWRIGSFINCF